MGKTIIDRVRSMFGMPTRHTFAPPARVQFSAGNSLPFNVLMDGLYRGIGSVDRETALSVPAILRGRNLICSISTLPLEAVDPDNRVVDHPLLAQPDPNVPRVVTMAQTVEDLLFQAVSWWRITRFDDDGYPVNAVRYAPEQVSMNPPAGHRIGYLPSDLPTTGVVYMDGVQTPFSQVIRFDSPNPALLTHLQRAVGRAVALDIMAEVFSKNPRPTAYLSPTDGADPAKDDEIVKMLDDIVSAAAERGIVYIPAALDYTAIQQPTPAELQLVPQQERVTLDIANGLGIDPEELGLSTTSRTYQNGVDRRQDRVNDTLSPYISAITDRLSMPDVTRPGHRVRMVLDAYLRADPKTRAEVQQIYHALGATDAEEIRQNEGLPPRAIRAPIRVDATVGEPVGQLTASAGQLTQFTAGQLMTFDFEPSDPMVDSGRREITGVVVPYGVSASSNGRMFRFAPGSLKYAKIGRIKLLRDHDKTQALGRAIRVTDTPTALLATFKVDPGPEGDRALAQAAAGTLDGLSPGVEFREEDMTPDPHLFGGWVVSTAAWRETSMTAVPAFDESRLISVRAHRDQEKPMRFCPHCGAQITQGVTHTCAPDTATFTADTATTTTPTDTDPAAAAGTDVTAASPATVTFSADQLSALMAARGVQPAGGAAAARPTVDPTTSGRPGAAATTQVAESLPYTFGWRDGRVVFDRGTHEFAGDVYALINSHGGDHQAADRVNALIRANFANVDRTDTAALTPNRFRPDMWLPQMDFVTPLWDMISAGTTDGVPFDVPKFSSSSALVGPATEETEPAGGAYAATLQTITPTQVWGKVEITRQAARRPASPQLSGILWDQMQREYYEDREAAVATFLNTLTAAADITVTGTPASSPTNDNDQTSVNDLEMAIAALQFVRGGNRFSAFAVHVDLYKLLARVKDDAGRPLYPMLNPMNANGTTRPLFRTIDFAGTTAVPSWALGNTGTAAANSWLFDPAKTLGWASAPERLDWNFGATVQTANIPQLSFVTIGIYGDIALANLDIASVRQVIFDPSV